MFLPCLVAVNGRLVVDRRLDPLLAQDGCDVVAIVESCREKVEDAWAVVTLAQQLGRGRQHLAIMGCMRTTSIVPLIQVLELDPQQCRLKPVETLVVAKLNCTPFER